jgi:hypothetical protein
MNEQEQDGHNQYICQEGNFFFYTSGKIENPKKDDLVKQEAILADEILLLMLTQYAFRRKAPCC